MLSYHNDPAVKAKYIARFEAHRAADEVIQGTGFDSGRGCFVGCTLDNYDHSRFPIEMGWPEWLGHLGEAIFEGLPEHEAPQFGSDLLAAVPDGVDLEPLRHHLAIKRMGRLIDLQKRVLAKHGIDDVIAALELVRNCHEAEINKKPCDWSAAESAAWSARSAAWSAWSAARSAARSAESAASAWSAAWSAWSAAESAESEWRKERDALIETLIGMQAAGGE